MRILMPAMTVAEWGGLHEYVVSATRALVARGHDVVVACTAGRVGPAVEAVGGRAVSVDWSDWEPTARELSELDLDLILSHGPGARELALAVRRTTGARLVVMFHGTYHDYVYTWADEVARFLVVSPSLSDFLTRVGKVEPWKIEVVPNGVSDSLFQAAGLSLDEKLGGGVGSIVMASRIAKDKAGQFAEVRRVMDICATARPDIRWQLDVLGDGPLRPQLESELRRFVSGRANLTYQFHGWVDPEEVQSRLARAVIGVTTGRGALSTLAVGTLCVASGARGSVGLQVGENLHAGLWSNFGDHSFLGYRPTPLESDIARCLEAGEYERSTRHARLQTDRLRSASAADESLVAAVEAVG